MFNAFSAPGPGLRLNWRPTRCQPGPAAGDNRTAAAL